jgi:putative transposase
LLGYSRQSYYQGIKLSQRKAYESELVIQEVLRHRRLQKRLGTRKLLGEMENFLTLQGFQLGRDALFDLLREHRLLINKRTRSGPTTTFSKHRFRKYPNIIRDFIPIAANQLWVSDITYIQLNNGFAYLSIVTDAYSRKIVGYHLHKNLSSQGPLKALKMALLSNPSRADLIHHSDRGVQYCCDEYIKLLLDNKVKISMTENGDPLENAIAERINGILKQELLSEPVASFSVAQDQVSRGCSTYNHLRPHNSINNLKPAEAHLQTGHLKRKWKNYYKSNKRKEESMISM